MAAINQAFQYLAWLIALVQFILGLYVLCLEPRGFAHRCVGLSLVLISIDTFSVGVSANAQNTLLARLPYQIIAATSAMILAATLLTSLALFQPAVIRRRSRFPVVWVIILLGLILLLLITLVDVFIGTGVWP